MAIEFDNPLTAGTTLIRSDIRSQNYAPGSAGWIIEADGDAEFNSIVIRGGTVVSGLALYYNGTPALGNLIMSIAASAGVDSFGNAYVQGVGVYGPDGDIQINNGELLMSGSDGSAVNLFTTFGQATLDLLPRDLVGAVWLSASLGTSLGASNRPSLSITSPSEDSNTQNAGMEMFGGGPTTSDTSILFDADRVNFNHDVEVTDQLTVNGIDTGAGLRACVDLTNNITPITTETVVMTAPSMTYKAGRAYRVKVWGLQQSTTASTFFLYRLRKGSNTIVGTIYKDQMRLPVLSSASTNGAVVLDFVLVNTTGSDITTAVTLTATCNAGTGTFAASAGNRAHITVEDVGLSADWVGQPIS